MSGLNGIMGQSAAALTAGGGNMCVPGPGAVWIQSAAKYNRP